MGSIGTKASTTVELTPRDRFNNFTDKYESKFKDLSIQSSGKNDGVLALAEAIDGKVSRVTLTSREEMVVIKDDLILAPAFKKDRKTGDRKLTSVRGYTMDKDLIKSWLLKK